MNRILSVAVAPILVLVTAIPSVGAPNATRITFPQGSYCGSFSGEISTSHRFLLELGSGQTLSIETSGEAYPFKVIGPTGKEISPVASHPWMNSYTYKTPASGDYTVFIRSETNYADLQFCAR